MGQSFVFSWKPACSPLKSHICGQMADLLPRPPKSSSEDKANVGGGDNRLYADKQDADLRAKKDGRMNQKLKTTIIGLVTTVISGLIGMACGVIAWFPGYIVTLPFGKPVPSAGIIFFVPVSVIGGLLGGVIGTLCCARLGKVRFNQPFDGKGALLFGLGGIIIGVIVAMMAGALPGFFFSPMGQ